MTAKGKINASKVQINDRVLVTPSLTEGRVNISQTKTGEGVHVARVIDKVYAPGANRRPGFYKVVTTSGTFHAAPIETMWLAPEDVAGMKRAHVEALAEDAARPEVKVLDATSELAQTLVEADHAEALTLHSQAGKVDNMNNESTTAETPATSTGNHTGSTVVSLLEKVWARIRADHPELPEVVIITGSGLVGASKWGHFRAEGWKVKEEGAAIRKHELFLAGEALAKGATQVLQTMLHEGAHTLAQVRGQQDTSRQGRWHNGTFRKTAEEMGLEHRGTTADKTSGYTFVTLTDATKTRYADLLIDLDREIRLVCHLPGWLWHGRRGRREGWGEDR